MKHAALWAIGIAAIAVLGGLGVYYFAYDGNIVVNVKDSVGIWSHVNVTFSTVQIHRSGMDNATWDSINVQTRTVDLAVLTNLSTLLGSARLAPGHYEQIRVVVLSAEGVTVTGAHWTLNVTDGGVGKFVQQFDVRSGGQTTVTLDIDLSTSIVWMGAGLGYTFHPVIGSVEVS